MREQCGVIPDAVARTQTSLVVINAAIFSCISFDASDHRDILFYGHIQAAPPHAQNGFR
jgi:hypothetical protein